LPYIILRLPEPPEFVMGAISLFTHPRSVLACDMVRVRDYSQMQGFVWSSARVVWSSAGVCVVKCRALCGLVHGVVFIMF
jgi:hypothetical protein